MTGNCEICGKMTTDWYPRHPECKKPETPLQIPAATRERYKEHGQQREATCFRDEQRKLNMLIKEIEQVLADFGLGIEEE